MANVTKLRTLIDDLGEDADLALKDNMRPFNGDGIRCPWLEWWKKRSNPSSKIVGLLLMQDWWHEPESIDEATRWITDALSKNPDEIEKDPTLKNLFSSKGWKKAIKKGTWLVTNAVWGIRKNQKKDLPVDTHRLAFPIWLKLVHYLSSKNKSFKLVVAGDWAVVNDKFKRDGSMDLKDYLVLCTEWPYKKPLQNRKKLKKMATKCKGTVYHVVHPGRWASPTRWQDAPPAD